MKKMCPIILIGPMAVGKSTVAGILAENIDVPNVPMDRLRWYYYFKNGFKVEEEYKCPSLVEKALYWKPFELIAVKSIIAEFPDSVIDFGAGHSYFTDPLQFDEAAAALKALPNIFLLMPSPDKVRSLEICLARLAERKGKQVEEAEIEINRSFIGHESNYRLAKHVIYTENKSPDAVAAEIQSLLI